MKKKFNKVMKIIEKRPLDAVLALVSIIVLLIGSLTIGFLKSFLIVGIIDALVFVVPYVLNKKQKPKQTPSKQNKPKTKAMKTTSLVVGEKITEKKKGEKKQSGKGKRIVKIVLTVGFSFCIFIFIAGAIFVFSIIKNAPEFDPNRLYQKEATLVYDNALNVRAKLGSEVREKLTYDELPEVLINAIIATEDSRFFQHNGFDLPRFLKASVSQVLGKGGGGASTISMQVVKNQFTSTEDQGIEGIKRKFTDIYMAIFKLEKNYTKQQILEFYANSYYMGGGNYGVEQACEDYFGKKAKDINMAEAAMIAGLFQSPVGYDPYLNPKDCEERRQTVLALMKRHGYISDEEYEIAKSMTVEKLLKTANPETNNDYQAFIDTVVADVIEKTGKDPYSVPMEIYTTLDADKQLHINKIMNGESFTWENEKVQGGAIVIDVKTGAVVAVGGGRNKTGQNTFNYATMIKRQIGSTAKPLYDYGPAIEYNNWSTFQPFADEPHTYTNGPEVRNWDNKYQGWMTLHTALKYSRNIPALKAFQGTKNSNIKTFVTNLGLSPEIESNQVHEAHSLGGYNGESPRSMAAAYAAFASGGYYTEPYTFTKVVYRDTNETYENKPKKTRAMSEETAFLITKVLEDTPSYSMGGYSYINGVNYCAKSGTTNFPDETLKAHKLPSSAINDAWISGYNDTYAISVWYGYDKVYDDYYTKQGNTNHQKLFQAVAKGFFTAKSNFKQPSGVVQVEVETGNATALLPSEFTPSDQRVKEWFKVGTEPTEVSKRYSQLDNVSNLTAKEENGTVVLKWDALPTPAAIDQTAITNLLKQLYSDEGSLSKAVSDRINYNSASVGSLSYDVYLKNSDGSLTKLGNTADTTYQYRSTGNDSKTFVVKSSYTLFKANASGGSEITIRTTGTPTTITSRLNGKDVIDLVVGTAYDDEGVTVMNGSDDITRKATITISIVRKSDNQTISSIDMIDPTKIDTYTIKYHIVYQSYDTTITRILNYK